MFATRIGIDENSTGADFEWWIRDADAVIGLLVQAKRLTLRGAGVYLDIDRATDDGRPQPERLIATARARRMTPLYVMYNGGRPGFERGPCGGGLPLKARGTTVTAATLIEALAKSSSSAALVDVQAKAIPWQCLADCPMGRRTGPLPMRILSTLTSYGIADADGRPVTSTDELDDRMRSLFGALAQLGVVDDPQGSERVRRELTAIASQRAAAPSVVVMDATGTEVDESPTR